MTSRLNHYQILGVPPSANGDEIARAFARESSIFRPHVFGALTEVCVAYEVLRDPVRRRAYDASIGLVHKPELLPEVRGVATAEAMVRAAPVERRMPLPAAQPKPSPTQPAIPLGPGADLNIRPEPSEDRYKPSQLPLDEMLDVEVRPVDWKRTGYTLGGFLVAACAVGGLAGWWSVSGIGEASQPEEATSAPLPTAKPPATPATQEIAPAAAPIVPEVRLDRPRPAIAPARRIERAPAAPQPAAIEAQQQADESDPGLSEPSVAEPPAPPTTSMPLPNRVVARTIDRIGYSCGSVAATAPVESAPGVYTVTCSSGQSYRASPVNGRYRFRRLGRQ